MQYYDDISLIYAETQQQTDKTSRKNRRKQKANKQGFKQYARIESQIKSASKAYRRVPFYERANEKIRFAEGVGVFELFSIAKAQSLYDNAKWHFGEERTRHVQKLLVETCKKGNRKAFAVSPSSASLSKLKASFPHFSPAIDQLVASAALSQRSKTNAFNITPLLLAGPPGVGKTAFCQALAKIIQVPFKRLDAGAMSTSAEIAGLSFTWSTGKPGVIYNLMTQSKVANPLIMLDELDKINGNYSAPIEPILLSLLEGESSRSFTDEGMQLSLDCRHLLVIATANDIQAISAPLLSRFQVVEIDLPTPEQNRAVIQHIYQCYINSEPWGQSFQPDLDEGVIDSLITLTPRKVTQVLRQAFGRAAIRGMNKVTIDDINVCGKGLRQKSFGFLA